MDDIDATRELSAAEAAGVPFRWMEQPSNDVNTACIYETIHGGECQRRTNEARRNPCTTTSTAQRPWTTSSAVSRGSYGTENSARGSLVVEPGDAHPG